MKDKIKTILSSFGIAILWIFYALVIRPGVLLVEIGAVILGFFADVVTFPVDYINAKMEEKKKEETK